MRVLVSTTAGAGHFGPSVPFARACVAAGHEVAVAAPESFAAQVGAAGFAHLPFADAPVDALGRVVGEVPSMTFDDANEVVVREVFGRLDAQAALPGLLETIERWRPDVVLRDPVELGSLAAAEAAGIPHLEVAIGMATTASYVASLLELPLRELDALADLPDGTAAQALRSATMLTTVPALLDDAVSTEVPKAAVHRFCDNAQRSRRGALPPPWGRASDPLVYVSFGSVAAGVAGFEGVYAEIVSALADQPLRVLLTTGEGVDPAALAPLPANLHVERWWPQTEVMAHCAAVVGHGGFGTTMAALAAGVPQVVVPLFSFDQRINATHVEALGAGVHVEGGPAAMAAVPDAVARLVREPSFGAAARSVADAMATLPPVEDAVDLLEGIAHP
jgi:UDP:flavonoid glycosyltransferase YjiC (YdhE family)